MTTIQPRPAEDSAEFPAGRAVSERQASRLLIERTVLDEQVHAARESDRRSWGIVSWLGPIVALAAIIVLGNVVAPLIAPRHGAGRVVFAVGVSVGGELLLLAALFGFGHAIAAREGGWRIAFGLDGIRGRDWLPWITGFGIVFACRSVVLVLANVLTDGRAGREASNLSVGHPSVLAVVVLAVMAVVLAPITEELMFRGLLLRSFMRRMSFWPAAVLSTALFSLFHVYEVGTLLGAVTLAATVATLGLGNCFLVRITGRLAPAIMVHATYNALALTVVVVSALS
jgi:membrane protease YdiL (CAAX protease family)